MIIDGCEVEVTLDKERVLLDIDRGERYEQWVLVSMTRKQAMYLGGLLIGTASALGVPLVEKFGPPEFDYKDELTRMMKAVGLDYPDPSAPCDNPGCTQCHPPLLSDEAEHRPYDPSECDE